MNQGRLGVGRHEAQPDGVAAGRDGRARADADVGAPGVTRDAQFGPTLVIGSGGVLAEALKDVVLARPPFDAAWAAHFGFGEAF